MKKIFTLVLALMGFAGAANAASVNDLVAIFAPNNVLS